MTCIACGSARVQAAETLSTEGLAKRWAALGLHGPATSSEIFRYVMEDIGTPEIRILQCADCGLEATSPARTWSANHYPHEEHGLGWDHEQALQSLAATPPARLLDVGCADGQFLARAAALGHQVTGVDFSAEDIEAARALGFEAHVADLSRPNALVDAERRFDAITLFQVIEHLEAPDTLFEQLGRLAAPGASLFIGCPSAHRYTRTFRNPDRVGKSDFWDSPPQHSLRWTPEALAAFCGRHGWSTAGFALEPLAPMHAAAHLAGLFHGRSKWTRRALTLWYLAWCKLVPATGIRLYFHARRFYTGT